MDLTDIFKRAWDAVDAADLPPDMRPIAYREAIRLLAPAQERTVSPPRDRQRQKGENGDRDGDINVSEDEIYDRVVKQTGVDRTDLEQIVHLDDDALKVSLPGLKLGANNAERARAVAQILTISRGFGLEESETPLELIRAECDRLRVYDQGNFSSHMKALTGFVVIGTGQNRRVRAKGPGIAAFPALVESLLGVG